MGWLWPLAPGTASSKSGTKEAGRGEVKDHEDTQLPPPLPCPIFLLRFLYCFFLYLSCHSHPALSFEGSGENGEYAFGRQHQGHRAKKCSISSHGLPSPWSCSFSLNEQGQLIPPQPLAGLAGFQSEAPGPRIPPRSH